MSLWLFGWFRTRITAGASQGKCWKPATCFTMIWNLSARWKNFLLIDAGYRSNGAGSLSGGEPHKNLVANP